MNRAFNFSFEALITLIFVIIIINSFSYLQYSNLETELDSLYVLQKEHDLLRVWLNRQKTDENMIEGDFMLLFGNQRGLIEVNGIRTVVNSNIKAGKNAISSETEKCGIKDCTNIKITVFY